jgi:membrane protein DedA with SNARE-associated domain
MNETLQFAMQHGTMVLVAILFVGQMGLPVPALPILVAFGVQVGTGHLKIRERYLLRQESMECRKC